jgi:ArsR family transcriptional regulator
MYFLWQTGGVTDVLNQDVLNQDVLSQTAQEPELRPLCCPGLDDPSLTEAEAEDIVVILKALADPVRLRLMSLIARGGEACACDLPAALGRSQPTVSHHLKVLVEAGLLEREKRGKWAWFTVRPERLQALSSVFQIVDPTA